MHSLKMFRLEDSLRFGLWGRKGKNIRSIWVKYSTLIMLRCMLVRDNSLISTCSFCNFFFTITKFLVGALQPEDNCVFTRGDWLYLLGSTPTNQIRKEPTFDKLILRIWNVKCSSYKYLINISSFFHSNGNSKVEKD